MEPVGSCAICQAAEVDSAAGASFPANCLPWLGDRSRREAPEAGAVMAAYCPSGNVTVRPEPPISVIEILPA